MDPNHPNHHNNQEPGRERADFLVSARIYQEQASGARHRVTDLNRGMDVLQTTIHNQIAMTTGQVQRMRRLERETQGAPAIGGGVHIATTTTTATTATTPRQLADAQVQAQLSGAQQATLTALRIQIDQLRAQIENNQGQLAQLIDQRNAAQENAERFQAEYNAILYQMAPPPSGSYHRNRRNGNGKGPDGGAGAGISMAGGAGGMVNGGGAGYVNGGS